MNLVCAYVRNSFKKGAIAPNAQKKVDFADVVLGAIRLPAMALEGRVFQLSEKFGGDANIMIVQKLKDPFNKRHELPCKLLAVNADPHPALTILFQKVWAQNRKIKIRRDSLRKNAGELNVQVAQQHIDALFFVFDWFHLLITTDNLIPEPFQGGYDP